MAKEAEYRQTSGSTLGTALHHSCPHTDLEGWHKGCINLLLEGKGQGNITSLFYNSVSSVWFAVCRSEWVHVVLNVV